MISIIFYKIIRPAIILVFAWLVGACSDSSKDIEAYVNDAQQAIAEGNDDQAAAICSDLMANDFDKLNESQLGRLAIIFMRLSESRDLDENMAEATQCVRQAWKLSSDSLRGFISSLPPEDVPHFVMLTRISGSIDFPPDLSEDHYADDTLHLPAK